VPYDEIVLSMLPRVSHRRQFNQMEALLHMKKIDIHELERAAAGRVVTIARAIRLRIRE
jgi:hypothetical protein